VAVHSTYNHLKMEKKVLNLIIIILKFEVIRGLQRVLNHVAGDDDK
jgi:hypothetical protein